ncbi:MAG TPA: metal-sulfur cluster assembly factor [Elusimicrobiota bacterium]|nr:metal-sulfur cluster assembly factor [Elusimicrobiota bacterium]
MDNLKQAALFALRTVVDPEVGLDVVSMGLIYGIEASNRELRVAYTLTSRGCPLGAAIGAMAQQALEGVAGSRSVALVPVWDPPWSPAMISQEGRRALRL